MFPLQDRTGCLEPEHLELLMSVVERLSEEAARWLLSKVGPVSYLAQPLLVAYSNSLFTTLLMSMVERLSEEVSFVWTWTSFYWQGSSNQQSCRGLVFSLIILQVLIRILLKPENTPWSGHFPIWHICWSFEIFRTRTNGHKTKCHSGILEAYYQAHLAGVEPTELAMIPEQV